MILWLNGAFGVGKSSVADAIHLRLEKSFIYDPEQAGYFLWDNFPEEMRRKGNFQHLPLWREINHKVLAHINEQYDGVIIVPMTVYIRQYYDEITGGLSVSPFILTAPKQTIIDRLVGRGDTPDGWGARHIDACVRAFEADMPGVKVDAGGRSADETAGWIIGAL